MIAVVPRVDSDFRPMLLNEGNVRSSHVINRVTEQKFADITDYTYLCIVLEKAR